MKILVIMHVESEGPGSLGTFLRSEGIDVLTVRLYNGDRLPDLSKCDAVVSMGGPMNVYEEDKYPFLKEEAIFLEQALHTDKPMLGICLGAQMIAKSAGARVTKSPKKEVGWGEVTLTATGQDDALFQGLPEKLDVLQWHEDMFLIPNGGILLASSRDCPHQAFRYRNAFGLQFHVEVTEEILAEWFADSPELDTIISRHREIGQLMAEKAEQMYRNFLGIIREGS